MNINTKSIIDMMFPQMNLINLIPNIDMNMHLGIGKNNFVNHKIAVSDETSDEMENTDTSNVEFEYNPEIHGPKNNANKITIKINKKQSGMLIFMQLVQLVLFILALYLSVKCNKGFKLIDFLLACCCSPCYIVYRLAVPCKDLSKTLNNTIKNINTRLNK